jgi:hypothetical protein
MITLFGRRHTPDLGASIIISKYTATRVEMRGTEISIQTLPSDIYWRQLLEIHTITNKSTN